MNASILEMLRRLRADPRAALKAARQLGLYWLLLNEAPPVQ